MRLITCIQQCTHICIVCYIHICVHARAHTYALTHQYTHIDAAGKIKQRLLAKLKEAQQQAEFAYQVLSGKLPVVSGAPTPTAIAEPCAASAGYKVIYSICVSVSSYFVSVFIAAIDSAGVWLSTCFTTAYWSILLTAKTIVFPSLQYILSLSLDV